MKLKEEYTSMMNAMDKVNCDMQSTIDYTNKMNLDLDNRLTYLRKAQSQLNDKEQELKQRELAIKQKEEELNINSDVTAIIDALTSKIDYEPEVFIDINNGNAPVVVVYRGDSTGLLTPILLNPDGTPYTGVNPAFRIPSSGNLNVNAFPYCDAGTTKIKYVVTDNGAYLSDFAQLPDGTPTTISNTATVGSCELGDQLTNIESILTSIDTSLGSVDLNTTQLNTKTTTVNTDDVTVTSSVLPTGASTEATLSALNAKVTAVDTGNVTVASSALPTGASTSALQTTGNASLSSIDTKTPSLIDGRQPTTNLDYGTEVVRGNIPGVSFVTMRGYNAANSTTNEPIWAQSGTTYPSVTSAQTLTISSSNAADNSAGTGANTVAVTYVRFSDLVEVTSVFAMNGQTPVTVTTDGYAINAFRVLTAGTNGGNAGTIYVGYGTVTAGVPASILATVVALSNVSQQAIYTVPAGKVYEIETYRISASALSTVSLMLRSAPGAILTTEFNIPVTGVATFNSVAPTAIPPGYQIQMW